MTNQEALKMAYSKRKDSAGEERDFLNTIIQALEQTRWIPVSERLPENDGTYLVTAESIGRRITRIRSFAENLNKVDEYDFPINKCGWYDYDCEFGYWEDTEVVAWVSLIEPYESQESGDMEKELSIYNGAYIGICPNCGSEVMSGLQETECYSCGERIILNTKI